MWLLAKKWEKYQHFLVYLKQMDPAYLYNTSWVFSIIAVLHKTMGMTDWIHGKYGNIFNFFFKCLLDLTPRTIFILSRDTLMQMKIFITHSSSRQQNVLSFINEKIWKRCVSLPCIYRTLAALMFWDNDFCSVHISTSCTCMEIKQHSNCRFDFVFQVILNNKYRNC